MKKIKRIGVRSFGKIMGGVYGMFGLIAGVIFSIVALMGGNGEMGMFGVGAVIFLPLIYGVMGWIFGMIGAWVYNVVAKKLGGVEVELE